MSGPPPSNSTSISSSTTRSESTLSVISSTSPPFEPSPHSSSPSTSSPSSPSFTPAQSFPSSPSSSNVASSSSPAPVSVSTRPTSTTVQPSSTAPLSSTIDLIPILSLPSSSSPIPTSSPSLQYVPPAITAPLSTQSTSSLPGVTTPTSSTEGASNAIRVHGNRTAETVAGSVVGFCVLLVILFFLIRRAHKRRRNRRRMSLLLPGQQERYTPNPGLLAAKEESTYDESRRESSEFVPTPENTTRSGVSPAFCSNNQSPRHPEIRFPSPVAPPQMPNVEASPDARSGAYLWEYAHTTMPPPEDGSKHIARLSTISSASRADSAHEGWSDLPSEPPVVL